MQNAIGIASVFGPFLMILGIWMLFYHDNMMKVCTSAKNTPGVLYLTGVINLLIGLAVLSHFNMWGWGLPLLVTLFGWFMVLRGLMVFFLPQLLIRKTLSKPKTLTIKGIIFLVWGFGMCWLAYWM